MNLGDVLLAITKAVGRSCHLEWAQMYMIQKIDYAFVHNRGWLSEYDVERTIASKVFFCHCIWWGD